MGILDNYRYRKTHVLDPKIEQELRAYVLDRYEELPAPEAGEPTVAFGSAVAAKRVQSEEVRPYEDSAEAFDDASKIDDAVTRYGSAEPRAMAAPAAPPPYAAPSAGYARTTYAAPSAAAPQPQAKRSLEDLLRHLDASFSDTLLAMIDERGLRDADVYKRANITRQHFSKIRTNASYQPKKQTVLALAIALELTLEETQLLLERAGFALTRSSKRDVVVQYFIEQGIYNVMDINLALYRYDQPLLG